MHCAARQGGDKMVGQAAGHHAPAQLGTGAICPVFPSCAGWAGGLQPIAARPVWGLQQGHAMNAPTGQDGACLQRGHMPSAPAGPRRRQHARPSGPGDLLGDHGCQADGSSGSGEMLQAAAGGRRSPAPHAARRRGAIAMLTAHRPPCPAGWRARRPSARWRVWICVALPAPAALALRRNTAKPMGLRRLGVVTVAVGRQLHLGAAVQPGPGGDAVDELRRTARHPMRSGATPCSAPRRAGSGMGGVGVARGIRPAAAKARQGMGRALLLVEVMRWTPSASGPRHARRAGWQEDANTSASHHYQNKAASADGISASTARFAPP